MKNKIKIKLKKTVSIFLLVSMLSVLAVFLPFMRLHTAAVSRTIGIGAMYEDALSSYYPANQYYFDIMQTANIHVRFDFPSNTRENAWRVSIYRDGSASPLQTKDFGGDSGVSTSLKTEYTDKISLTPGSYYINVTTPPGYSILSSAYKIGVEFSTASFSSSNSSVAAAAELRVNSTVTGSIRSSTDANYFKVNLPAPGVFNISFSVSSAIDSGNWTVLLYDKNQTRIQMARVGYNGTIGDSMRTSKLDKQRLPAGDYYIKVVPHSETAVNTAEYRLGAAYTPETSSRYEKEPNSSAETANIIQINAPVIGNMNSFEDYDYYKFEVGEYRDIKVEFSTPDSVNRMVWTVYLFDGKGGVVTYNLGQSGTLLNDRRLFASDILRLDSGTYYIAVFTYNLNAGAYSNEDYTLCIRADGAPIPLIADEENSYSPTEIPPAAYGVNRELSGKITGASAVQKFDFGLNHSGLIYITFQSPVEVTRQSWIINILDKNSKLVYSGKFGGEPADNYGSARTAESYKVRVPAGSYYAEILPINAYDYSQAAYSYRINYIAESKEALFLEKETHEKEYNDTPSTANKFEVNHTITGNISNHEDVDYFKLTLDNGGNAGVDFETLSSVNSNAWVIDLLKADLTEIYSVNFGADGAAESERSEYKKASAPLVRLPKGEYYIRVRAYNSIHFSNEDYKLTVNFTDESPDYYETEFNNLPINASPLRINADVTGNIFNSGDLDYFKINIDDVKDIQLKFSIDYRINHSYWSVKLFNSELREVKSYKIGEGGVLSADGLKYFKTERINVIPGDYYILISPYTDNEYSDADYILKAVDAVGQRIDLYQFEEDKPSDWALREVQFAYGYDLIPVKFLRDFTTEMKRGEFCELAVRFLEITENKTAAEIVALNGRSIKADAFTDTNEHYILSAYALGIVNGRGEGIFDPNGNITREEAAAMLMRLGMLANININTPALKFNDTVKFSPWATEAITYVSSCIDSRNNRVMNGYADGGFHSGDYYSREQAYMTMFRLFSIKKGLQ